MQIRDRIRELRRVPASELRPSPRNWRQHPPAQRDALRGVLAEIGFADACLARELEDGSLELIDGHLRAEEVGDAEIPVLVLDVNEDEAGKVLATHDPLAGMAEADQGALDELLSGIETDSEALQGLLDELAAGNGDVAGAGEVTEDEAPAPPADPVTRSGDVWLCGEHRVMCGDATDGGAVSLLLNGAEPFIMVTDPPYGVEYDSDWRLEAGINKPWQTLASGKVNNDDRIEWVDAYSHFPGHVAYVWHAGRHAAEIVLNLHAAGFGIRTQVIWSKPSLVIGRGHYHWQHEPCWYAIRKGGSAKWCGDRKQSTIWQIANMHRTQGSVDDGKMIHSTQKPVECMARPIRNHGDKSDDVYDPFLGSGTTLIAAEQLGRKCYDMEISPQYCDVICKRYMALTGESPVRESDEVKFTELTNDG